MPQNFYSRLSLGLLALTCSEHWLVPVEALYRPTLLPPDSEHSLGRLGARGPPLSTRLRLGCRPTSHTPCDFPRYIRRRKDDGEDEEDEEGGDYEAKNDTDPNAEDEGSAAELSEDGAGSDEDEGDEEESKVSHPKPAKDREDPDTEDDGAQDSHGNKNDRPADSQSNDDEEPDDEESATKPAIDRKDKSPKGSPSLSESCRTLKKIYHDMGGEGWIHQDGWSSGSSKRSGSSCCNWFGVACRGSAIIAIDLPGNKLTGSLSSAIFGLQDLERLNASQNLISGHLPDEFDSMRRLHSIALDSNSLDGQVPATLLNSNTISSVHLSNNLFTGPADFSQASALVNLIIHHNNLTSLAIHPEAPLQRLLMNDNQMTGDLLDLSGMTQMNIFSCARNQLTGHIFSLKNMRNLTRFDARSNCLAGNFPSALSSLTRLEAFDISNNQISGTFPSSMAAPSLKICHVIPNLIQVCPPASVVSDPNSLANRCHVSCAPPRGKGENPTGMGNATVSAPSSQGGANNAAQIGGTESPSGETGSDPAAQEGQQPLQQSAVNATHSQLVPFDYSYLDPATNPSLRYSVNGAGRILVRGVVRTLVSILVVAAATDLI